MKNELQFKKIIKPSLQKHIKIICLKITLILCCFNAAFAQEINNELDDNSTKDFRSINATIGFGNSLSLTNAKPAYLLTFEKNGLIGTGLFNTTLEAEKLFNTGFYVEYRNDFFSTLGFGIRAAVDPIQFINQFSNTMVDADQKLDVNLGVQWGYILFFDEWIGTTRGFRNFNPYLNARYYFTNNLGIHAELGRTAAYTNVNVGLSFRY